jgi:hypothetical protein
MNGLLFVLLSLLVSCTQMQENYRARVCHYDGAFEEGTNDAQAGHVMRGESIAQNCPDKVKADVRKGYREGYTTARANTNPGVVINNNIKDGRYRRNTQSKMCIESFGKKVCGYGCIESYGKAKCARHPGNNCLDEYGKIVCGSNCREEYGKVLCEWRE